MYKPKSLSKRKLFVFKVIALALPFVLVLVAELLLRFFYYGNDFRLFVEDPKNKEFLVMNRHASGKFFTDSTNAPVGNSEIFRKQKAEGTFRIFVLGESTGIGYPYMHNGSFHRWLQYRLMHTFPEKNFEVINLSLTAVNSYTVLDFGKQLVNYEPDAVLIYAGHNEYYGALGVGSTSNIGSNPLLVKAVLRLRDFRVVQLLENAISGIRSGLTGKKVDVRENLMKRMASKQEIPYQSEEYTQGICQFEGNMSRLCAILSAGKIPVLISTVISNEKDLGPLASKPGGASSAIAHFKHGQKSYKNGDFKLAKDSFVKAKELDLLRFRAPEAINASIQKIARRYPLVFLVDSKRLFEEHSPNGIIGNETLLEHVHPNLFGYALLSESFYQTLKKHSLIEKEWKNEMSFMELHGRMPITSVDSLNGEYQVRMLKAAWPFNEPIPKGVKRGMSFEEQLAGKLSLKRLQWNEAMAQLMDYYVKSNDRIGALRVAEAVMLEFPYEPTFYYYAGKFSLDLEKNQQAVLYLGKAFQLQHSIQVGQLLYMAHLKLDQPAQAIRYLDYAIENGGSEAQLRKLKDVLQKIIKLKAQVQHANLKHELLKEISFSYQQLGNTEVSERYEKASVVRK